MCFPVNFAKFLRTTFLTEHLRWLLLMVNIYILYHYEIIVIKTEQCHDNEE